MNARYMAVSLLPLLFSITLVNAQQKYKGKLVSKLGQEQSGEITINLDGSNNELIEITYSEQTKTNYFYEYETKCGAYKTYNH